MTTLGGENHPVDVRLLNLKLTSDYTKNLCAFFSSMIFSIVFYYIHVIIDSSFSKNNEKLAYEKYRQKYAGTNSKMTEEGMEKKYVKHSTWMIKNLQVSFIHSSICCIALTYTFYVRFDMFDDLLSHFSNEAYILVAMSIGYFVYDFYDMYQSNKVIEMWVVTAHHMMVISLFTFHLINVSCLGYSLIALSMEFNSVFLHARKLIKLYGYKSDHILARLTHLFNFLTFVVFRFFTLFYLYVHIYWYHHRVSKNYLVLLAMCIGGMTIMNMGIFYQLVIKDSMKSRKQQRAASTTATTANETSCNNSNGHHSIHHSLSSDSLLNDKTE